MEAGTEVGKVKNAWPGPVERLDPLQAERPLQKPVWQTVTSGRVMLRTVAIDRIP